MDTIPVFESFLSDEFPNLATFLVRRLGRSMAEIRADAEVRKRQNESMELSFPKSHGETCQMDDAVHDGPNPYKHALMEMVESSAVRSLPRAPSPYNRYPFFLDREEHSAYVSMSWLHRPQFEWPSPPAKVWTSSPYDRYMCPFDPEEHSAHVSMPWHHGRQFEWPSTTATTWTSTDSEWQSHALRNIFPHVCMFENCPTPDTPHENCIRWHLHMLDSHLVDYLEWLKVPCQFCGTTTTSSQMVAHTEEHLRQIAMCSVWPREFESEDSVRQARQLCQMRCLLSSAGCHFETKSVVEYKLHFLTHFRGYPLPRNVTCFFCQDHWSLNANNPDPGVCWNQMLTHTIDSHLQVGQDVSEARLELSLLQYIFHRELSPHKMPSQTSGFGPLTRRRHERTVESSKRQSRGSESPTDEEPRSKRAHHADDEHPLGFRVCDGCKKQRTSCDISTTDPLPCGACQTRGDSCTYVSEDPNKTSAPQPMRTTSEQAEEARARDYELKSKMELVPPPRGLNYKPQAANHPGAQLSFGDNGYLHERRLSQEALRLAHGSVFDTEEEISLEQILKGSTVQPQWSHLYEKELLKLAARDREIRWLDESNVEVDEVQSQLRAREGDREELRSCTSDDRSRETSPSQSSDRERRLPTQDQPKAPLETGKTKIKRKLRGLRALPDDGILGRGTGTPADHLDLDDIREARGEQSSGVKKP